MKTKSKSLHLHVDYIPRFRGEGKGRRRCSAARSHDYITRQGPYTKEALAKKRKKSEQEEALIASGHLYMPRWGVSENGSSRPFWRAADRYERANARLATTIEAAIARDIYAAGLSEVLITRFAERQLAGHPLTYAVHCTIASDGGPQPHTHIELTERLPVGEMPPPEKFFLRPDGGGALKDRRMNSKYFLPESRKGWADLNNELLEQIGSDIRLDPRSLEARGIKRLPGYHHGPTYDARLARAQRLAAAGKLRKKDIVAPTPSMDRWNEANEKLKPIRKELFELHKLQQENEMKIEIANQNRAEAALHEQAATDAQEQESAVQEIRMRIGLDRQRQRVLSDEEADRVRKAITRALAGWRVKWKTTGPGEMPAFTARSGPHRIDFDGHEITGHDESEATLATMVQIARAAGKHCVEINGSPAAKRRLAELCRDAGIEVVEPSAQKGKAAEPMTVEKSASPTPFDTSPSPFNQ